MNFTQASFLISAVSILLGILISYKIYLLTTGTLVKKGHKLLAQLAAISIAVGIGFISNEMLGGIFLGVAIRQEYIQGKVITNLIFLPLVFYVIILIVGGWSKKEKETDFENNSNKPTEKDYEAALTEYESTDKNKGLYAKLYAESNGNEQSVKLNYLKIRAQELSAAKISKSLDVDITSSSLKNSEIQESNELLTNGYDDKTYANEYLQNKSYYVTEKPHYNPGIFQLIADALGVIVALFIVSAGVIVLLFYLFDKKLPL